MMEPHQNSLSSFPRREVTMKGFTKDTIPKSSLLFYTPVKPSFQLVKKEDGEGHNSMAKENPKAKENLVVARINGANVHNNSTCSTPIKTPFGTPSLLQTPTCKLSFLSASGHKHSVGAGRCGMNEDTSITRTPFRLLAGKNLDACLFSPSHTPRPIAFLSPFDKLLSPALKGHAKRVLVMPPQLSPARRVPVKQKGSQLTTAGKQSMFATPKSSRVDNVRFATPKSSRVDNVLFGTPRRVPVKQKGSQLTTAGKQSLFATPNKSSRVNKVRFATPQSSRVDNVPFVTPRRVPVKQKGSQLTTAGKQFATPKSSRVDKVRFATPKSSRVDNVPFVTPRRVPVKQKGKPTNNSREAVLVCNTQQV